MASAEFHQIIRHSPLCNQNASTSSAVNEDQSLFIDLVRNATRLLGADAHEIPYRILMYHDAEHLQLHIIFTVEEISRMSIVS